FGHRVSNVCEGEGRALRWEGEGASAPPPHPHPVQPRYSADALLRQPVGCLVGGDLLPLGDLEDPEQSLVDLARFLLRALGGPAVELAVDVDDAAAVDH